MESSNGFASHLVPQKNYWHLVSASGKLNHRCKDMIPVKEELVRGEDEKQQDAEYRYREGFQHNQAVVGNIAVQLALGYGSEGGSRQASIIIRIAVGDGWGVCGVVDTVSAEQRDHEKESNDEEKHPHVGHDYFLPLV